MSKKLTFPDTVNWDWGIPGQPYKQYNIHYLVGMMNFHLKAFVWQCNVATHLQVDPLFM